MKQQILTAILIILIGFCGYAANPMATTYSYSQCQGSLMPYPQISNQHAIPDSLQAVLINHVGRHGSRYPASQNNCVQLLTALHKADSIGCITPLGQKLKTLTQSVIDQCNGQWGALDSLGMAEQRWIASRMMAKYPDLLKDGRINAISSYSPRSMMSMYSFTHQLDRLNNHIEVFTSTGRQNDALMRPFDVDQDYINFRKSEAINIVYKEYFDNTCPLGAIDRVLGSDYPYSNIREHRDLAIVEYYVLAGLSAMSVDCDLTKYFTTDEINALWSCFNLRQYLQRTATTLSTIPAEIASDLLLNIIATIDDAVEGKKDFDAYLRFGHAETLMPLLSLMRLPGCYYMTNYFDTVAQHWMDFYVVPMAANLQIALLKNKKGKYYVCVELNECPVPFMPNSDKIYVPWSDAREYMMRCVPMYAQP